MVYKWHIYVILETGKKLVCRLFGTIDEVQEAVDDLTNIDGEIYVMEKVL